MFEWATRKDQAEIARRAVAVDADESSTARGDRAEGRSGALIKLQRAIGNVATTRLIQTKLMVGAEDDPLEREADRVARTVVDGHADGVDVEGAPATISRAPAVAARAATTTEGEGEVVGLEGGPAPATAEDAISRAGSGHALPDDLRRSMEATMGTDLSAVRVHTGSSSDEAARQLQARAFTTGSDVHFAAGQYDPSSKAGQELLAHEVTHTVQQQGGGAAARSIQRMPSPAAVKSRTGRDRNLGKKILGKTVGATTSFNALMDFVQAHSDYILRTVIASTPTEATAQIARLHSLIDDVVMAAENYLLKDKPDPAVDSLCKELVANAPLEKRIVSDLAGDGVRNANQVRGVGNPKWYLRYPTDPQTYRFRASDSKGGRLTAGDGPGGKGQNKEIKQVTNESGDVGFFANDDTTGKYEGEEWTNPAWMLEMYGVKGDLKLGNRSIAMSRLDQLLDGGVIARTERGLLEDKLGTFQMKAEGEQMSKAVANGLKTDDPTLARLLSRLQLIDIIAGQVDRHAGNYFVQRDDSGKVTGVTGIDLDMAWGNEGGRLKFDIEGGIDKYPGFSRYVDKELAQRIIALRPDDLRAVLVDLLDAPAIEAAVKRLQELQKLLSDGITQLLEPKDWTDQIRAKVMDEKQTTGWKTAKSYFGRDQAKE